MNDWHSVTAFLLVWVEDSRLGKRLYRAPISGEMMRLSGGFERLEGAFSSVYSVEFSGKLS